MAKDVPLICPTAKAKYFFEDIWTAQITLIPFNKLAFARNRIAAA
ncbi:hypothetical protein [Bradyrhizobium sp. AUGA SZCCT0431]|nr:hypothetical protein [Bradyrhizobium sp. AUGA SZCCT0431]